MAPKKAAAGRADKMQAKQDKAQKKEEAQLKRNEAVLQKALQAYEKCSAKTDLDFLVSTLEATPGWIAPLARLVRQGALNTLLKVGQHGSESAGTGEKWTGKNVRRVLDLPDQALTHMLEAAGLKVDADADRDTLVSATTKTFWVTSTTPLPQHAQLKYLETLRLYALKRLEALDFNYLHGKKSWTDEMWTVKDSVLKWEMDGQEVELPQLPAGAVWQLTDAFSPACEILSSNTAHKMMVFTCRSFFAAVEDFDPTFRWKYTIQEEADEPMDPSESAKTAPTKLAFKVTSPQKV